MRYSRSSNFVSVMNDTHTTVAPTAAPTADVAKTEAPKKWQKPAIESLTWIFRLLLGGTFIFSGFVKGIDPWGSLYKFEEYMSAFGLPVLDSLLLTEVFALCAFEFTLGVILFLGCYRKSSPILAVMMMAVMLPLTLWIAISDPVSDCGCFGDFLLLSNWATFWKNVALTAMAIWLIKFNRRCGTVISPAFQWLGVIISLMFIMAVTFAGYMIQPLLDFRPYKVGTELVPGNNDEDTEAEFSFLYEKDGQQKEFGIDDELPDEESGWKFVERRSATPEAEVKGVTTEADKTLRIWTRDGAEDVTEQALGRSEKEVLLLMPDLAEVSPATTWKINALQEWISAQEGEIAAITDADEQRIAAWEEMALPDYEIYTADDTAIKEVARGNPAVVMTENGKIIWKSTLAAIDASQLEANGEKYQPSEIIIRPVETLKKLTLLYVICMAVPVVMSFIPRIRRAFASNRKPQL